MTNNLGVVLAAAGNSSRMGGNVNKPYMMLGAKPVLVYSIELFEGCDLVDEIIIVANSKDIDYCREEILHKRRYRKVAAIIPGGENRQESVRAGLAELNTATAYVAVHDGARPLFTVEVLQELLAQAQRWGAAVPGIQARDTVKEIGRDNFVGRTLERSMIYTIQTPQVFNYANLLQAYKSAYREGFIGTDDASLYEKYAGRVKLVTGRYDNIKITTPEDLDIARFFLEQRNQ